MEATTNGNPKWRKRIILIFSLQKKIEMEYNDFLELAKGSIQDRIYVGQGSFPHTRERLKVQNEHPDIIEQYELTESELFVMFMMLTKN